jgi:hypothetical protein
MRIVLLRLLTAGYGTSRTSGEVRPESAKWAKPDIDPVSRRSRLRWPRSRSHGAPVDPASILKVRASARSVQSC